MSLEQKSSIESGQIENERDNNVEVIVVSEL